MSPNSVSNLSNQKSHSFGLLKLLSVLLLLVVLAAFGLYLYRHHQDKPKAAAQPYSYTYSKTKNYVLAGQKAGTGVSLEVPAVYSTSSKSGSTASQVIFSQGLSHNKRPVITSNMYLAAEPAASAPTTTYLQNFGQSFINPKNSNHLTAVQPLENFVSQRLNSGYMVNFSTPKALTTANLKSQQAWSLNFSAVAKQSANQAFLPPLTGTTILAVGKSTFYYFSIDAVSYNWTANQNFWQTVINSIKVDQ